MTEKKSPEFLKEMRYYCAGCILTTNCPVGMYQFKTCTQKGSNLISMIGKHIPTWAEEQSIKSDTLRTEVKK